MAVGLQCWYFHAYSIKNKEPNTLLLSEINTTSDELFLLHVYLVCCLDKGVLSISGEDYLLLCMGMWLVCHLCKTHLSSLNSYRGGTSLIGETRK